MLKNIRPLNCIISLVASIVLSFGLYNIHSISDVTEGGVLGLTLLLEHWLRLSPAISGFVLNLLCYCLGRRLLGREFLVYSAISAIGFSLSYKLFELFPVLWPQIAEMPLVAALAGACFVGVGAGFCVLAGGAPTGDDALAMSLSKLLRLKLQWIYLISDTLVLLLSLSYIPISKIAYSALTVVLSGQIIGLIQKIPLSRKNKKGSLM